jgi:hypothetical protein
VNAYIAIALVLLSVPLSAHFALGVHWFGWKVALVSYGAIGCLVGGMVMLYLGLGK